MHFLQANQYKVERIQWLGQCPLLLLRKEAGFLVILCTLQGHNTENSKQIFPEKELRSHSLNFCLWTFIVYIARSICLLQENMWIDPGNL
jgi:hypothetical protein